YLRWRGISQPNCSLIEMAPFWTDPAVLVDVEEHIAALLNHVNVYTHVAYKDDPTILGWDLLNGGGSPTAWTRQIAQFIRGIDTRHLILSGYANARLAEVDACVAFIYPHWFQPLVSTAAAMAARAQILRDHNYSMRGIRTPPHAIPPRPTVTSVAYGPTSFIGRIGARVYWQGSAGAEAYSVQRAVAAGGPWVTVCERCVTDLDDGYADVAPA